MADEAFLSQCVYKQVPCVLRGLLPVATDQVGKVGKLETTWVGDRQFDFNRAGCAKCTIDDLLQFVEKGPPLRCQGYGCDISDAASGHNHTVRIVCNHSILAKLVSEPTLRVEPDVRYWKHTSGHYTPAHYDANLVNILNIGLSGSKTWWIAPPSSRACLPLGNLCWNPHLVGKDVIKVTINAGDAIFIPSCWVHAVRTERDATNIDLRFHVAPMSQKILQSREFAIVALHQSLGSYFFHYYCKHMPFPTQHHCASAILWTCVAELGLILALTGCVLCIIFKRYGRPAALVVILTAVALAVGVHVTRKRHGGLLQVHTNCMMIVVVVALALVSGYRKKSGGK